MRAASVPKIPARTLIACLLLGGALSPPTQFQRVFAQAPNEAKRRFLEEAPSCWAASRTFEQTLQGSYKETVRIANLKTAEVTRGVHRHEIKQNAVATLDHALKDEEGPAVINCANSKYAFQLRYVETKSAWLLLHIDTKGSGQRFLSQQWTVRRLVARRIAIDAIFDEFMADWLNEKTFKVVSAKTLVKGNRELVEVAFEYTRSKESKQPLRVTGRSVFDPKMHWCILEQELYQSQTLGPQRTMIAKEYREGPSGMPIAFRESRRATIVGVYQSDADWEYDLHAPLRSPPDGEFTLTAFGLPEPHGVTWDRPPPYYLWIGGAAFASLGIALGCRRFARRRRLAASALPAAGIPRSR